MPLARHHRTRAASWYAIRARWTAVVRLLEALGLPPRSFPVYDVGGGVSPLFVDIFKTRYRAFPHGGYHRVVIVFPSVRHTSHTRYPTDSVFQALAEIMGNLNNEAALVGQSNVLVTLRRSRRHHERLQRGKDQFEDPPVLFGQDSVQVVHGSVHFFCWYQVQQVIHQGVRRPPPDHNVLCYFECLRPWYDVRHVLAGVGGRT